MAYWMQLIVLRAAPEASGRSLVLLIQEMHLLWFLVLGWESYGGLALGASS